MESRRGCCAEWPKPCPYHEGWADARERMAEVMKANVELAKDFVRYENDQRKLTLIALLVAGKDDPLAVEIRKVIDEE